MTKNNQSQLGDQVFELVKNLGSALYDFVDILARSIYTRTFPLAHFIWIIYFLAIMHILRFDQKLIPLLITKTITYKVSLVLIAPCLWVLKEVSKKRFLVLALNRAFNMAGLKSFQGYFPKLIFDAAIGGGARKMMFYKQGFTLEDFKRAKPNLESALRCFIDDIVDINTKGQLMIRYSYNPMELKTLFSHFGHLGPDEFFIGKNAFKTIKTNFDDTPHLLIAGETSSGKSTFMRQLIFSLYKFSKGTEFYLIDLKRGLEFSLFDKLPRVKVAKSIFDAFKTLLEAETILDARFNEFAREKVKDLAAYNKKKEEKLNRLVVVIDEAAEFFLASRETSGTDVQKARVAVSRISRLGRAVGIHLVIGTQRPDAKALDTQVKANLVGKVCFQMADTASSVTILNNTRARDLPSIPGRAIWQKGLEQIELQTPYLDTDIVEKEFANQREETPEPVTAVTETQKIRKVES